MITKLDTRNIYELKGQELKEYQQQILIAFHDNQISRLLIYKNRPSPLEAIPEIHPILFNQETKQLLGAGENEQKGIRQFTILSNDNTKPMTKVIDNTKISGPFVVHISASEENGKDEPYLLYFAEKADAQRNFINNMLDRPILLLFSIMVLSSPLLWYLAWSIGHPLRRLRLATNTVASGNFTPNLALENQSAYEFRQVGRSFNHMTETLKDLIETRQQLLSSISHELRTPLTRLQLAAALLRRRIGEVNEIKRINTETERLDCMINDLLKLSRNQLNMYKQQETFVITELWTEVLEDIKFEAQHQKIKFSSKIQITSPNHYYIHGNQQSLASALENVLRNALKYTKDELAVSFRLKGNNLTITVDDNGSGVSEDEYKKIFHPFYRVDETRTRTTGGTGLGLAIVQNSLTYHRGDVYAQKSPLGGLRIVMVIPLYNGGGNAIFD